MAYWLPGYRGIFKRYKTKIEAAASNLWVTKMSEEEYTRLLKQFPQKLKDVLNWSKYFERLVNVGRRTGRTDIEIGNEIRKELRGEIDDRVIRRYLPASMKHDRTIHNNNSTDTVRRIPLEQSSPPPAIVEIQPEPEAEPEQQLPKKQTYILNSKTCKGWPCERYYIYEIEVDEEKKNVTKMYAISD